MELYEKEITRAVIGAAFEVYNVLGPGFLEEVYRRAMCVELQARGIKAEMEVEIRVKYKAVDVGLYRVDLRVNDCLIVELKVAKSPSPEDEPQLPKATGVKVGLLIDSGRTKVEFKRMVV